MNKDTLPPLPASWKKARLNFAMRAGDMPLTARVHASDELDAEVTAYGAACAHQAVDADRAQRVPDGWTQDQIATAAWQAEISDGHLESLLINLPALAASPPPGEPAPEPQGVPEPAAPMQLEAAAKKMAELFDYPWAQMPYEGRQKMRENVIAVLQAIGGAHPQPPAEPAPTGAQPAQPVEWLQQRVKPWLLACFGEQIANDRKERNHRFLEESLELVQACGCTASEAHQLVDYVFSRPLGEPAQEVGGVMITLAALCLANGLDMHDAGEVELARIWTMVEKIRAKQAAKPKHSPLPEALSAQPQQERKPLSPEEISEMILQEQFLLVCDGEEELTEIIRAVERRHGITSAPKAPSTPTGEV